MNLLITGRPGVGKTTLIKKALQEMKGAGVAGFYTEEIRENGLRKGFRLVSVPAGRESVLSHVEIKSRHRVGRYGVDVEGFEGFLDEMKIQAAELAVIDEIGKMECFSVRFRHLIMALLDTDKPVVATIAIKGTPFIEGLKRRPGTRLLELTEGNRDDLARDIVSRLKEAGALRSR